MNSSNVIKECIVFIDKNECLLTPCQNNGTCINSVGSYQCSCEAGWQNKDCEEGIRIFHSPLCFVYMYKDTQIQQMSLYILNHKFDFFFLVDRNECFDGPCQNNGTCINNNGSYTCRCEDGWESHDCEKGKPGS